MKVLSNPYPRAIKVCNIPSGSLIKFFGESIEDSKDYYIVVKTPDYVEREYENIVNVETGELCMINSNTECIVFKDAFIVLNKQSRGFSSKLDP